MQTDTQPQWTTTREALGKTWTVGLCTDDTALGKSGSPLGKSHATAQEININVNMPTDTRDETLLHELLHLACYDVLEPLRENTVGRIGGILYAYLRGFGVWQPFPWPDCPEVREVREVRTVLAADDPPIVNPHGREPE